MQKIEYLKIGEMGKIVTGKTPSTKIHEFWDNGNILFITPTDIDGYDMKSIYETERYVSHNAINKQKNTLLPINSISISCIASIGKICKIVVPSITNQQINSIIPNDNMDPDYLYYLLRYNLPYMQLVASGTGSGTPIINKNKFSKFKFPIFIDKIYQNKVAKILNNYDLLIEKNKKQINVSYKIIELVYNEWFVHFRFPGYKNVKFSCGIPEGWNYVPFSQIIKYSRGISYSSEEINVSKGINLINLKNINPYGGFNLNGLKIYDGKYKENQLVKKFDLIMGVTDMTQERRIVGSVALIPDINGVISSDLIKLDSKVSSLFLYCMFKYGNYSKMISEFGNGANVIHLKPQSIRNQMLLIPDENVIKKFDEFVYPIFSLIINLNRDNLILVEQRDSMLSKLMSGEIVL